MTKRSEPGEPMDLANMRSLGVRSLAVTCLLCHHEAVLDATQWPDHVPVPAFGPRMVCMRCGIVGADVRPNWREQPKRPALSQFDVWATRTMFSQIGH
jgi:hypothetical protein